MNVIVDLLMVGALQSGTAAPMVATDPAATACPAKPAALPSDLAGWTRNGTIVAGAAKDTATIVPLGARVSAALHPTREMVYAVAPGKAGGPDSHGGILAFVIPTAGRYRVALDAAAWIDVLQEGKALVSVGHAHGPACSGIRKMVEFDLAPGRYILQLAGNERSAIGVMVARER